MTFVLSDVFTLFVHSLSLSLLAVGGGMSVVPDFHRFIVVEKGWLDDTQFTSSIALAQAAPGPNILFIALLGWNSGFNAGGYGLALLCAAAAMVGMLIPSTTLTLLITRWAHRNHDLRILRAFKQGMAPLVIALLLAAAWLLGPAHSDAVTDWKLWMVAAVSLLVLWRTRIHLLWILGAGAVLGALGWV
jgi:chromate transporter